MVAAEVRKLAERSQVAAQEIGQLAGSSVTMAEQAGAGVEEMGATDTQNSEAGAGDSAGPGGRAPGAGPTPRGGTHPETTLLNP